MKIATWNVNSVRARLSHLLQWLQDVGPDVVLLQETKATDENFPFADLENAHYHCVHYGQKSYNGVAILSKTPITEVVRGLSSDATKEQARIIAATVNHLRLISVYVPNGQSVGSEKYQYKLSWLADLSRYVESLDSKMVIIGGDYNIAPADIDIYDAVAWGEDILASPPERDALQQLLNQGYFDAYRMFEEETRGFTWWDYRASSFRRNLGIRIDLFLVNEHMRKNCLTCAPDLTPRRWEKPSDHTPVILELDLSSI